MNKPKSVLEYPVVIAKVLDSITISVPDIGEWLPAIPAPQRILKDNRYVTQMDDAYALKLGKAVIAAWRLADHHIQEKKWAPEASRIRDVLKKAEKDLTVPAFTKAVNKTLNVSQDTIRRDIDRNIINAYKTTGGHRRIPGSELGKYLAYLELKVRHRPDNELLEAMRSKEVGFIEKLREERKKSP